MLCSCTSSIASTERRMPCFWYSSLQSARTMTEFSSTSKIIRPAYWYTHTCRVYTYMQSAHVHKIIRSEYTHTCTSKVLILDIGDNPAHSAVPDSTCTAPILPWYCTRTRHQCSQNQAGFRICAIPNIASRDVTKYTMYTRTQTNTQNKSSVYMYMYEDKNPCLLIA